MTALAYIHEIDGQTQEPLRPQPDLVVDFNPQTLRLTHATTGPQGSQLPEAGAVEAKQASPSHATGTGTELSLDLLFDTSRTGADVRDKTTRLVVLARPVANGNAPVAGRSVRFTWGSFFFNGSIRTLGETIDLFGADGIPLRATVSVTLVELAKRDPRPASAGALGLGAGAGMTAGAGGSFGGGLSAAAGAGASATAGVSAGVGLAATASAGVGATPLRLTTTGDTVQSVAARAGVPWKALAAANGIDNPRRLPPGTFLDVRVAVR